MIEVHNLTKRYGEKTAVEDLSFTVAPGRVTGFLGPNGSGKSTTMRLILGLDAPSQGRAEVAGRAYRDYPAPCTRSASCSRLGRCTPGARPTTTCWRWPRRTASGGLGCRS